MDDDDSITTIRQVGPSRWEVFGHCELILAAASMEEAEEIAEDYEIGYWQGREASSEMTPEDEEDNQ